MPGGDRTGPMGTGPRTGRGMGYCSGYDRPGFANPAPDFRVRYGFGCGEAGRGWRHRFYTTGFPRPAPLTPEQETAILKARADRLKSQLDAVQKRIEELSD